MADLGNNLAAAMALNRFGLGARPTDEIPASPVNWLLEQLQQPDPYRPPPHACTTAQGLAMVAAAKTGSNAPVIQLFQSELEDFLDYALITSAPFRERLVWFWANHFAVLGQDISVAGCAGAFIREAIRPYVTGNFTQMLLAVMQHPATMFSLNNNASTGPDSQVGMTCQVKGCLTVGINENAARECLELFTIGVNGGYSQADVDSLALLLSGWSVNMQTAPYGFAFNQQMHEPGNQTFMGNSYAGDQSGGLNALTWLSTHPLCYQQLASKLVAHFTSDTPSPADVAAVTNVLISTGGNLGAAAAAVVKLRNAWAPYTKFRSPMEYTIAAMRAVGYLQTQGGQAGDPRVATSDLGQTMWQPQFPNGYSDAGVDWTGTAQVLLRSDFVATFAQRTSADPYAVAASALGPLVRPSTISIMRSLRFAKDQMTMLLLSPEFQRR